MLQAQNGLIVIIVAAIGIFVAGAIVGPTTEEDIAQGFVGLNGESPVLSLSVLW